MFNLIMGPTTDTAEMETVRMMGYTDDVLSEFFAPGGVVDPSKLISLPTLMMPEPQNREVPQIARMGNVENLTLIGQNWRFRFVPDPSMAPIPTDRIQAAARELHITDRWEFNRTHWAVKPVDLHRALRAAGASSLIAPTVFRLPTEVPTDPDLLAVMMPFDGRFDRVYAALQTAADQVGMTCVRADDVWKHQQIMDDIIDLIWRARVIVADLSGKNPNVFYEAGIAYTIGREVIPITQSMDDIPFDLRSIRSVPYLNNEEGRGDLQTTVTGRLRTILGMRSR